MIESHDEMTDSKDRRILVFTFGWSPEFVIRPLVEEGVSESDIVLLIAGKPETEYVAKRVSEALRQVESFLGMAGVSSIYYREVDTERDFIHICRDIAKTLEEFRGERYKFYLTGGMRVLIIATLVIAKLLSSLGIQVEIKLSREDRPVFYTVPIEVLKIDLKAITEIQRELLRELKARGEAGFEELAIGRSEVTVRKLLGKLRERGLVTYTLRVKNKSID